MNLMVFSFVGNTSIGSKCFLDFAGGHPGVRPARSPATGSSSPPAISPFAWVMAGRTW